MPEKEGLGVSFVRNFEDIVEELVDDVSEAFSGAFSSSTRRRRPLEGVRVSKSQDLVTVEIDVPGAGKEDVRVRCAPGRVRVEWTPKGREKRERELGVSKRADLSAISAKAENGVLTLVIPAKPDDPDEREVSVG